MESKIPKKIFQIYHDKKLIKNIIMEELINLNPDYEYKLYDFNEGKDFIKENFENELGQLIICHLNGLQRYAHKSDLLRYCLLYILGGVYIDVDLKQVLPINKIIELSENSDFILSTGLNGNLTRMNKEEFQENNKKIHRIIANGLILTIPGNKIIFQQIINIIKNPLNVRHCYYNYKLYEFLMEINNKKDLEHFQKLNINDINVYVFKEITYEVGGKNCFINKDNQLIMFSNNTLKKSDYLNS